MDLVLDAPALHESRGAPRGSSGTRADPSPEAGPEADELRSKGTGPGSKDPEARGQEKPKATKIRKKKKKKTSASKSGAAAAAGHGVAKARRRKASNALEVSFSAPRLRLRGMEAWQRFQERLQQRLLAVCKRIWEQVLAATVGGQSAAGRKRLALKWPSP